MRKRRVSGLIRRLWILQVDHSVGDVFRTKREAMAAAKMRRRQTRGDLDPFVVGPYVLQHPEVSR